jgi:hypothetical protein
MMHRAVLQVAWDHPEAGCPNKAASSTNTHSCFTDTGIPVHCVSNSCPAEDRGPHTDSQIPTFPQRSPQILDYRHPAVSPVSCPCPPNKDGFRGKTYLVDNTAFDNQQKEEISCFMGSLPTCKECLRLVFLKRESPWW